MYEQWHPLGAIGIITAFNFPLAVWSWNAAIAAVCGDAMIWKPSPTTPLTAIAAQHICNRVMANHGVEGVFNLVIGENAEIGERMINDERLPLISFTGSVRVGRHAAQAVARRLGRSILELGGNNGIIVSEDADPGAGDAGRSSLARSARLVSAAPPRGACSSSAQSSMSFAAGWRAPTRACPSATR